MVLSCNPDWCHTVFLLLSPLSIEITGVGHSSDSPICNSVPVWCSSVLSNIFNFPGYISTKVYMYVVSGLSAKHFGKLWSPTTTHF